MEPSMTWLVVALVAFVIVPFWAWHLRRSRQLVERWAEANTYTIEAMERRFLRAGPFWWRGRGHEVFRVLVRDRDGNQRRAYIRTGGWLLGQFSDETSVKWDREP